MANIHVTALLALFLMLLHHAASSSHCDSPAVEKSLDKEARGANVVMATITKIRVSNVFEDANDLEFLRRVAAVETNDGETAVPGEGGIWGVSMEVLESVDSFITKSGKPGMKIAETIENSFCIDWTRVGTNRNRLDFPLYSALAVMLRLASLETPEDILSQAELWIDFFNPSGDLQLFIDTSLSLMQDALLCQVKGVDMIFLMDESGSIGDENFEIMRQFAITLTDKFEIGPERTQVGWINFAVHARVIFNLNDYQEKTSLHEAMRTVSYIDGSDTFIDRGLLALYHSGFVESAGYRNTFDIPAVAIVLTDGRSYLDRIQQAATVLRENRNIDVFVVGVGRIVPEQLQAIASAGITTDIFRNIFILDNFAAEEFSQLQETLRARACFRAMFHDSEVSHERLSGERTIPPEVTVHLNTVCPPEGLTINACGTNGETHLYISKTPNPSSASYDEKLVILENKCVNTFVKCSTGNSRRRRQASNRIYMAIEGVGDDNVYNLNASTGDSSTPRVKLLCKRDIEDDGQGLIISCTSDRMLTNILCSLNNSPFMTCTLPWVVSFTPPTTQYHLQIQVTDSLNLTDNATFEYQVGQLVLDCSLSEEFEVVCTHSNQLAPNSTTCSFNGNTEDPCTLPHRIDVKGLPVGAHPVTVTATDVFGSTAQSTFDYLVVEDRVGDDMVMSVVLDISPHELGVTSKTLSLCYQVHGEEGKFYNLLSDKCVSVNAHISQPVVDVDSHVMDAIGIHAAGSNGTCFDVTIKRKNCAVYVNGQFVPVNTRFEEEDVIVYNDGSIARNPTIVHVTVPNCGIPTLDSMYAICDHYNIRGSSTPTEVLQFKTVRGTSPFQSAHGLIGQFWGRFTVGQSQTATATASRELFDMTVFQQNELQKFSGFVHGSWESRRKMCLYSGDRQGFPLIQGTYSDYEMEEKFSTQYNFSTFDTDKCVPVSVSGLYSG